MSTSACAEEKELTAENATGAAAESPSAGAAAILGTDVFGGAHMLHTAVPRMNAQTSGDNSASTDSDGSTVGKTYCPGELLRRSAYCGPMPPIADLEVASEVSTADTAERTSLDALLTSSDQSPVASEPAILELLRLDGGYKVGTPSSQATTASAVEGFPPGLWGDSPEMHLPGFPPTPLSDFVAVGGPPGLWTGALDFGTLDARALGEASAAPAVMGPPGVWDTSAASHLSYVAQQVEASHFSYAAEPVEAGAAAAMLVASASLTLGSQAHHLGDCKPCAFVFKEGCANGVACKFCHLCDPSAKKRRKRDRQMARRVGM